ncbi:MAG: hypothetical protein JWM74_3562 [Myxococcaceae bacterium]|jgi:hypothetical protein|nr:hypothetical protein [Myxococcaceae bacterium]
MAMRPTIDDPLFEGLKRLRANWPTKGWSWDTRLACVTSSFSTEFQDKARAAAGEALTIEWTPSTLAKAPTPLREIVDRSGGLRAGQLLLAGGVPGGKTAFGLWWPWGDGFTISCRVGLVGVDPEREPYPRFREVMGVTL